MPRPRDQGQPGVAVPITPEPFGRATAAPAHHVSPGAQCRPCTPGEPRSGPRWPRVPAGEDARGAPWRFRTSFCVGRAPPLISMATSDGGKCQQAQLCSQGQPPSPQSPAPPAPRSHPCTQQCCRDSGSPKPRGSTHSGNALRWCFAQGMITLPAALGPGSITAGPGTVLCYQLESSF